VLAWLVPIYDRWLSWKATADLTSRRYVEVAAEDLAADWPAQRRSLFARLGVDDFETPSTFDPRLVHHRNDQFDPVTRARIERALERVIPAMGYA
jgi:omega-hydroxy-beta-dihydromenaquinone-9 sulfotransferase